MQEVEVSTRRGPILGSRQETNAIPKARKALGKQEKASIFELFMAYPEPDCYWDLMLVNEDLDALFKSLKSRHPECSHLFTAESLNHQFDKFIAEKWGLDKKQTKKNYEDSMAMVGDAAAKKSHRRAIPTPTAVLTVEEEIEIMSKSDDIVLNISRLVDSSKNTHYLSSNVPALGDSALLLQNFDDLRNELNSLALLKSLPPSIKLDETRSNALSMLATIGNLFCEEDRVKDFLQFSTLFTYEDMTKHWIPSLSLAGAPEPNRPGGNVSKKRHRDLVALNRKDLAGSLKRRFMSAVNSVRKFVGRLDFLHESADTTNEAKKVARSKHHVPYDQAQLRLTAVEKEITESKVALLQLMRERRELMHRLEPVAPEFESARWLTTIFRPHLVSSITKYIAHDDHDDLSPKLEEMISLSIAPYSAIPGQSIVKRYNVHATDDGRQTEVDDENDSDSDCDGF